VFTRRAVLPEGVEAVAGWDDLLFDEEDTLYYKIGVLETKEYYPCIDLAAVFNNNIPINLDRYSLVWWSNTAINTVDWTSIKDLGVMAVGSDALIKFIRTSNGVIKPVLMLVGAKTFTGPMLERLIVSGGARLEIYNPEGSTIHSNYSGHVINNNNAWICYREDDMSKPEDWSSTLYSKYTSVNATVSKLVYPRIKFKSLAVKTDSSNLRV